MTETEPTGPETVPGIPVDEPEPDAPEQEDAEQEDDTDDDDSEPEAS